MRSLAHVLRDDSLKLVLDDDDINVRVSVLLVYLLNNPTPSPPRRGQLVPERTFQTLLRVQPASERVCLNVMSSTFMALLSG